MIELKLTGADLAKLRFGYSPLTETLESLNVLHSPAPHPQHRSWAAAARSRVRHLDQDLLLALARSDYTRVSLPLGDARAGTSIGQQLQLTADCPAELLRADLAVLWAGRPAPAAAQRVIAEGPVGLRRVADLLQSYWELAVEPYWPSIRTALEAEIAYGARQMAEDGIQVLLESLHPQFHFVDDALQIRNWSDQDWSVDVAGRNLILIPSAFRWPYAGPDPNLDGSLSLVYGPRQIAGLWAAAPATGTADPLGTLLGHSRAGILRRITAPASTSKLARDLNQSPAAVSAHLSALVRTGLATSWRSGRYVLYQRTPLADRLLNVTVGQPDPGT